MKWLSNTVKGYARIGQTAAIVAKHSTRWVFGEREANPRLLRHMFEELGATYIKLGQFIASSPTFFPQAYVEEFQLCLDRTQPFPFRIARSIIENDLERPLSQVFSFIDPVPLASASIAQVHAARLISGEDVVVKVQKPGVGNVLLTDLNFLYLSARIAEFIAPKLSWISVSAVVEEIQKTMMEECDFIKEANNLKVFRQFLDRTHNHDVVVPKVYEAASSRRVLTMERLYGVPLTDLETIRRYCDDPERTLINAMNTWFASLTQCEFFHADVHAGNLMALEDGRVGFIDFGIVGRISPGTWEAVSDFISAVMIGDFDTMADAMIRIGVTNEKASAPVLASELRRLFHKMDTMVPDSQIISFNGEEDVNNLLMDMIRIGEDNGIHFPREFALLLKQFLYFDRYVHLLAPELDMFVDERLNMLH
jgi:predicted unusual protein kinase regulating ubiquinone biosynthesis (AarF/ABC1/UbiB family)